MRAWVVSMSGHVTTHRRWRSRLLAMVLLAGVIVVLGGLGQPSKGQEKAEGEGVGVLYPADGCVLEGEVTAILAVAPASKASPRVSVDGQTVDVERMPFSPAWGTRVTRIATTRPTQGNVAALLIDKSDKVMLVGAISLGAGRHVIEVGGAKVTVFRKTETGSESPQGWLVFHTHQKAKDKAEALACERCHRMSQSESGRVLGTARAPGSCETCHTEVALQLIHRHVMNSLSKCQTCHDPHGSSQAKLLTASQEYLCTRCHEGGHSKR
ncbi:MAG TPA: cytochrome c3 family protein [Tepidisphaeraceae bacterium]|nr:cytochrome c3 family protein [Tepidisphaeraceae bacterium]